MIYFFREYTFDAYSRETANYIYVYRRYRSNIEKGEGKKDTNLMR